MLSRALLITGRATLPHTSARAATAALAQGTWRAGERWEDSGSLEAQRRFHSSSLFSGTAVSVGESLGNGGHSLGNGFLGSKERSLTRNSLERSNYTLQSASYARKSKLEEMLEEDHEPLEVGVPPVLRKGDVALVGIEGELISKQIAYKEVLARAKEELFTIKVVDESGDRFGHPIVRYYTTDQLRNQEQVQQDRLELDKHTKKKEKIKELRFSSVIAEGDVLTKIDRVENFLLKGYKVRICVVFKKVWTFDEPLAHDILHNVMDRVKPLGELVPNSISTARGTLFGMIQPNQAEIDKYIANGYTLEPEEEDGDGDEGEKN